MTDRPILFSAPMVRGLIREVERDGTGKTQTRRLGNLDMLNDDPTRYSFIGIVGDKPHFSFRDLQTGHEVQIPCRIVKGDRLYVREHWRTESKAYDDLKPSEMDADYSVIFEADGDWKANKTVGRFRQGMHMPRWASRLTLTVTDVRVQRLQEISREDAKAEGFPVDHLGNYYEPPPPEKDSWQGYAVASFCLTWSKLNGPGSWDANPWIVALTFTVERRNIDAARAA